MLPMFTFKSPSVDKTLYKSCFARQKRHVVMVRLHTLSSWLPKHKGFARRNACESCYGFRVTSEVTSSIAPVSTNVVMALASIKKFPLGVYKKR